MYAAVDLGSNSFRLHVGKPDGQSIRIVASLREPIRLAAGLDKHGNLTPASVKSALSCLERFSEALKAYPLEAVRVVATNTIRIAKNAKTFIPAAEAAIGYPIEVISGEEEGRLIFLGVASSLDASNEKRLVVDIGGGSTELICGQGADIRLVESFSIGSVRQSLVFFPEGRIHRTSLDAAVLSSRGVFEDSAPVYKNRGWDAAYGTSGTIRSIAEVIAKNQIGDGEVNMANLEALAEKLAQAGHVDKLDVLGIKPDRAPVFAGGLAILIGIMRELDIAVLHPVDAGLRMGLLQDLQMRANKIDRRDSSIAEFMGKMQVDKARAARTAALAIQLYRQLGASPALPESYVEWSALLHESGRIVSHTGFHKHGAYLVSNADLAGFTVREQELMSMLILGQKGNLTKLGNFLSDQDGLKAVLSIRMAAALMRLRFDQPGESVRLRLKGRIELEVAATGKPHSSSFDYWVEKERDCWSEVGLELMYRKTGKQAGP